MLRIFEIDYSFDMSVLRLSAGGVSFQHRPCVAGHGPGIRVVITVMRQQVQGEEVFPDQS